MKLSSVFDYLVLIIFAMLGIFVVLFINSSNQPKYLQKEVINGELFCYSEEREYWCRLNDICIRDNYLYVLFGDQGILNIYDNNGTYLKSFAFYNTNGETALYSDGQYVYLQDHLLNFYVFSSGEWIRTIAHSDYGTYLEVKDTFIPSEDQKKEDETQYYVRFASVYRKRDGHQPVQVINRPLLFTLFQGVIPFLVIGYGICVILVLNRVSEKYKG